MASSMQLFSGGANELAGAASDLFKYEASGSSAEAAMAKSRASLLSASADRLKGQGDVVEGQMYTKAAGLADLNATYTKESTAIQETQADRALFLNLGGARSAAAASGGTAGGSAEDILRDSASQGALNRAVLTQQGLITEAGYQEQGESYRFMTQASNIAAQAEEMSAQGEEAASQSYVNEADAIKKAGQGSLISGIIKGVAGVGELAGAFL